MTAASPTPPSSAPLSPRQVDAYLERIRAAPGGVDLASLASLQLAHLVAVPFENLDPVAGTRPSTALDHSYRKVVERGRGGWCFELNGAFGALLASLGFPVSLHSAQVWDAQQLRLGPPLDHACLVVRADGEDWLVDVGFGDCALRPVRLATDGVQPLAPRACRVERRDDGIHLVERVGDDEWELQYVVDPAPRSLADFQPRSDELAGGAGGGLWTSKPFATRALAGDGSRVWLLRDRLKRRDADGAVVETPVSAAAWAAALHQHVGMVPPESAVPHEVDPGG